MSEKVRPSILSKEAYDRIVATLRAHGVQDGQIVYCFEDVFVYGVETSDNNQINNVKR